MLHGLVHCSSITHSRSLCNCSLQLRLYSESSADRLGTWCNEDYASNPTINLCHFPPPSFSLRIHNGFVRLVFLVPRRCLLISTPCCNLYILTRFNTSRMMITPMGTAITTNITYPMYSAPSASITFVAARNCSSSAANNSVHWLIHHNWLFPRYFKIMPQIRVFFSGYSFASFFSFLSLSFRLYFPLCFSSLI